MSNLLRCLSLSLLLTVPVAGAQVSPPLSYPALGYQGPQPTAPAGVREVKPLWTLAVDKAEYGENAVLVAANRVLVKVGGTLQARDLASGKWPWKAREAGRLLAASEAGVLTYGAGQLVSRRLSDGRVQWKLALPDVRDAQASGDTLYVTTMRGAHALNALTGRVRWQYADSELTEFSVAASGVVFWEASKGEPHFPAVVALDGVSGKLLYQLSSVLGPLAMRDGQALFKDFGAIGPDDRAQWSWLGLRSGKVGRSLSVQADFQCPGTEMFQHSGDGFYAGGFYYLNDRCGTRLSQWADAAPTGKTPLPPTRTFAAPDEGRYRLGPVGTGPVGEYLLFESRAGELRLIPTSGRSAVSLNGVKMPTGTGLALPGSGPVSRLDAAGNVIYVGRMGGDFLAYDAAQKKALYTVHLPWRGFGPTFRSGGYAVLTTAGGVAVVKAP